ncbi:SoxR reducing system RseC family protein [Marinilabiliaceae bacterium ANBcel2]|nr:SoxR reducing system RseC family protein [Marinilabiliaceae bacterium ANBcel2]
MDNIKHSGTVVKVQGDLVQVKIAGQSACASCQANSICGMTSSGDRIIDVKTEERYKEGDSVTLFGKGDQGLKAVWWAYILPVILLMIAMFITYYITDNENLAGAAALLVLVPYFFILRLANKFMKRSFIFTITK